jgi:hypothetical protein
VEPIRPGVGGQERTPGESRACGGVRHQFRCVMPAVDALLVKVENDDGPDQSRGHRPSTTDRSRIAYAQGVDFTVPFGHVVFDQVAPVRVAPVRSAPKRSAPVRSAPKRRTLVSLA